MCLVEYHSWNRINEISHNFFSFAWSSRVCIAWTMTMESKGKTCVKIKQDTRWYHIKKCTKHLSAINSLRWHVKQWCIFQTIADLQLKKPKFRRENGLPQTPFKRKIKNYWKKSDKLTALTARGENNNNW